MRASITSIDNLKEFRACFIKARESLKSALSEAESELQRIKIWLLQDQRKYWETAYRKRQELFQVARRELQRKKGETTMLGNRRSFVDEEKAFQKAKFQLEEAENKLKAIKRWAGILDKEIFNYKGMVQGLSNFTQEDIPKACGNLEAMIISLEKYADYTTVDNDDFMRAGEREIDSEADKASDNKDDKEKGGQ